MAPTDNAGGKWEGGGCLSITGGGESPDTLWGLLQMHARGAGSDVWSVMSSGVEVQAQG